jgi:hypothetical protein
LADGHALLARAVQSRAVPLPPGAAFGLRGASYWSNLEARGR